jgi:uncharacterized membrane protein YhaH (DUF805 family)
MRHMGLPRLFQRGNKMDNIVALYTTTDGRISRKSWWLGLIGIIVVNIIISLLIFPIVGLGGPSPQAVMDASADPAALSALINGAMQTSGWASLILFLIFAFPMYALHIKRRHDRDNNGLDAIIFIALTAVLLLSQALGLAYTMGDMGGVTVPVPTMLYSVLGVILFVYGIYMLVVLGFLKGTPGPNQYGPDPLGGTAAATA